MREKDSCDMFSAANNCVSRNKKVVFRPVIYVKTKNKFRTLNENIKVQVFRTANKNIKSHGSGKVRLNLKYSDIVLNNTLYIPESRINLLSVQFLE